MYFNIINQEVTLLNLESVNFGEKQIKTICSVRNAEYVGDTEKDGVVCSVFYGKEAHPVSGSRYFAIYYDTSKTLMITDGSFIEDQRFSVVTSNEGEKIYSRYRHDMRYSEDGSVFIDGGREYTRTNSIYETYKVVDGKFVIDK